MQKEEKKEEKEKQKEEEIPTEADPASIVIEPLRALLRFLQRTGELQKVLSLPSSATGYPLTACYLPTAFFFFLLPSRCLLRSFSQNQKGSKKPLAAYPWSDAEQMMALVHDRPQKGHEMLVFGAPEAVLSRTSIHYRDDKKKVAMNTILVPPAILFTVIRSTWILSASSKWWKSCERRGPSCTRWPK